MPSSPPIRYARSGDLQIAWRAGGTGERDALAVLPTIGTCELLWEPPARRLVDGLGSFARVISFDRRGSGLSDPVASPPTLEEQMADVDAVLDAAAAAQVVLYAETEGALMAINYAASHPDRVSHLVLVQPLARTSSAPGYEWPPDPEQRLERFVKPAVARWGTGGTGERLAPVLSARDPAVLEWFGRWERLSASPTTALELFTLLGEMDVREVLPLIGVPTLVIDRPNASGVDSRHSRYIADRIPDAKLVEVGGRDSVSFGEGFEELLATVHEFVLGTTVSPRPERALATVLFTDIAGSTDRLAELGDAGWRELLARHDELTREAVSAAGGRPIKSTGDGFLASFDGPAAAVRCALALLQRLDEQGLEVRAGLHAGEVELIGDDLGGIAVHTGARIAALAEPGEVLVSSTIRDLVAGSGLEFSGRGEHELRGIPEPMRLFVADRD